MIETYGSEAILEASKTHLKYQGNKDGGKILDMIVDKNVSNTIATIIKKPLARKMTPIEGLALTIEAHLTQNDYENLREAAKNCNSQLFPSYKKV